ncbi:MAG: 30S ribosomal protein S9 [Thermodesulfobacteriota bacterium]
MAAEKFYATGKRKSAIARVWLVAGNGSVTVNKHDMEEYFGGQLDKNTVLKPLTITDTIDKFNVMATLKGGGKVAQSEALRHGIAKALTEVDGENRAPLKKAGLLTRDSRVKERKKYGQKGARARFQFSKR